MVSIVQPRQYNPGQPRQASKGVLESALESFVGGLGQGLARGIQDSFSEYFEKQREEKYQDIIQKEIERVSPDGKVTPEVLLEVSRDAPGLPDSKRQELRQNAQLLNQFERVNKVLPGAGAANRNALSPEEQQIGVQILQDASAFMTEAQFLAKLREAGIDINKARPLIQAFKDKVKHAKEYHKEGKEAFRKMRTGIDKGILGDKQRAQLDQEEKAFDSGWRDAYNQQFQQPSQQNIQQQPGPGIAPPQSQYPRDPNALVQLFPGS